MSDINVRPLLLTKKMTAKELSVSVSQVDELVKANLLPPTKLFPDRAKSSVMFHSKDVYSLARKLRNAQNPSWDTI